MAIAERGKKKKLGGLSNRTDLIKNSLGRVIGKGKKSRVISGWIELTLFGIL